MGSSRVALSLDGPVAHVVLDRPGVRNAFDPEMVRELHDAVGAASARDDIRVIVLAGRGSVFCAGADLGWMRAIARFTRDENLADARRLFELYETIDRSPKAVVACVQGAALGGGAGLAAVAVAAHAVGDAPDERRAGAVAAQDLAREPRPGRGVTRGAGARVLLGAADVVEQRGEREHPPVRPALRAEPQREREHPLDVVEAVAAPPGRHAAARLAAHGAHERVAEDLPRGRGGGARHGGPGYSAPGPRTASARVISQ